MGLLVSILSVIAAAETSCLPEFTAVQVVEVVSALDQPGVTRSFPLKSENARGRFSTKAILNVTTRGRDLELETRFDPSFEGVSLAFNLYALQVIRDGEVVLWEDYTQGCAGPGLSFYPGRVVPLPTVKLPDDKRHRLHILLWGRL